MLLYIKYVVLNVLTYSVYHDTLLVEGVDISYLYDIYSFVWLIVKFFSEGR